MGPMLGGKGVRLSLGPLENFIMQPGLMVGEGAEFVELGLGWDLYQKDIRTTSIHNTQFKQTGFCSLILNKKLY